MSDLVGFPARLRDRLLSAESITECIYEILNFADSVDVAESLLFRFAKDRGIVGASFCVRFSANSKYVNAILGVFGAVIVSIDLSSSSFARDDAMGAPDLGRLDHLDEGSFDGDYSDDDFTTDAISVDAIDADGLFFTINGLIVGDA